MLARLARNNLLYDWRRFLAATAGICFSVTLVLVQLGLFVGLARNASQIVDRSPGDVWIVGRNTGNFQWGQPIPRRTLAIARSTPGVGWAREMIVGWTRMRHPDGGQQQLEVVGFDLTARVGAPWHVVAGSLESLAIPARIALDRSAMAKIGRFELGQYREVDGRRVRIDAITDGITSFTTVPFLFTSLATARDLCAYIGADETVYVVAGLESGADVAPTVAALRRRLPDVDVFRRDAFSDRTRRYWMFETGMGIGFLLTSMLAVLVGTVIVSQAIYAATSEHLPEYGTLKALGTSDGRLAFCVAHQACLAGVVGAVPGAVLGVLAVQAIRQQGLEAVLTPLLVALTVVAAVLASIAAAATSVARIVRLEPALVFRG
jgi:putative ABC transport system permease protein